MDATAVIASIQTKYKDLFEQIRRERASITSVGRLFLDKIIQVPIHVPPSTEAGVEKLVRGITERGIRPLQRQQPAGISVNGGTSVTNPPPVQQVGGVVTSTQPLPVSNVNKASYSREEVREAILLGSRLLLENPRQIKRFINLFRLYVYIANEHELFEEELQLGLTMNRLAIWIAWSIRWGDIVKHLLDEIQLSESKLVTFLVKIAGYLGDFRK